MFSRAKLTTPAASIITSSTTMNSRCLSAKATIAFIDGGSTCTGGPVDEQCAARYYVLAGRHPFQHFNLAVTLTPDPDPAQPHLVAIQQQPDACAIAFVDHRFLRHRRRFRIG